VLALFIIVAIALAALAGYLVGVRQRPLRVPPEIFSPVASPSTDETSSTAKRAVAEPSQVPLADSFGADRFAEEKARIIRSRDAEAWTLRQKVASSDAVLAYLEALARERERLFAELADARAETARYRQLIVDIENNAPPPILSGPTEPDDLKLIVGVGPVLERMLHTLGVTTFRQIARWTEREVAEFDAKLPEFPGRIVRDQWITQARALHRSKYGEALDVPPPQA
jgi:predicted flap endonuclease-1-like 5' DNA nuclease